MSRGGRSRAAVVSLATLELGLALAAPATAATAPSTPIDLFNGYRYCSTDLNTPAYLSSIDGVLVEGLSPETDSTTRLTERFQFWPADDPARTTTLSQQFVHPGDEGWVRIPEADLSDGQTYAWRAQAVATDGTASDWSASCYFRVDTTHPANAPMVTSPNYPDGGQWDQGGEPVQINLGAAGVDDVEGYVFSWYGASGFPVPGADIGAHGIPVPHDPYDDTDAYVRASALGGTATVKLIPPSASGPMTLTVASLDRAYNRSPVAAYTIRIASTAPTVTLKTPDPEFDGWAKFLLQPDPGVRATSPITGYTVKFSGQTDKTINVDASADGTAHVRVKLDGPLYDDLTVTSTSANGWVSDAASWSHTFDTTPTVTSDAYPENQPGGGVGVPGTFTFSPKVDHVASYTYRFDYGPPVTVNAGRGHAATVAWTPDQSDFHSLEVYATTADGLDLTPYDYFFTVN